MSDQNRLREQFIEEGFAGPIRLLDPRECQHVLALLSGGPGPAVWTKGRCLSDAGFHRFATREDVLGPVKAVLGEDVLLWGARMVHKKPGVEHPWHSDIECCGDTGRSVSAWVAIEGAGRSSSLQVISHSHRFGMSLQEAGSIANRTRSDVTTADALRWAQERDARSRLHVFDICDGDALFFDGRLWHYSRNTSDRSRTAVLLQYCTPDASIRMPLGKDYEWPFKFSEERAPCILVSGTDRHSVNLIAPPPPPKRSCVVRPIDAVEFKQKAAGWRSGRVFRRSTPVLKKLWSHVSILEEGAIPHEPHRHEDEELLIVLEGTVDIIREDATEENRTSERLGPGAFVYHAAFQSHTLRSAGPGPATYVMFKWIGEPRTAGGNVLASGTFDMWTGMEKTRDGWRRIRICQSPTSYLQKLNVHLSVLEPGAGYAPHHDPYDVALVVLSGTVETLDRRVGPQSVVFYPAGERHGMTNPGAGKAIYLVVEFHAN